MLIAVVKANKPVITGPERKNQSAHGSSDTWTCTSTGGSRAAPNVSFIENEVTKVSEDITH